LAELGEVYELENKPDMALKQYQKAVEMEPSNPRLLDLLLKISIIMKRKDLAQQAFTDLRNADPENKKLAELQTEIDAMSDQA
jgi:tetratricopeptide (TPR) repeat protein